MNREEFQRFEAELEKLKDARPTQEFVSRLVIATAKRDGQECGKVRGAAQRLNLLHRRFSWWRRRAGYGGVLPWLAGAVALVIAVALGVRHGAEITKPTSRISAAHANSVLKPDNVEIDRQLVSAFDAVARLPSGEPVRFRCRQWMDQVVLRDSRRGLEIEQRQPRLEIVPVGFETY